MTNGGNGRPAAAILEMRDLGDNSFTAGSRQERRLPFKPFAMLSEPFVILSAAKDLMAIATGVLVEMP